MLAKTVLYGMRQEWLVMFNMAPGHMHHAAQEKPPDEEQDDAPARLPSPPPEFEVPEEKVDIIFSAFSFPHEGHVACSSSSLRKHRYSKVFPQFLHLNS